MFPAIPLSFHSLACIPIERAVVGRGLIKRRDEWKDQVYWTALGVFSSPF
jgi:hypothetical protein